MQAHGVSSAFNTQSGTTTVSFPTEQCLSSGLSRPITTAATTTSVNVQVGNNFSSFSNSQVQPLIVNASLLIQLIAVLWLYHHCYLLIPILFMCDLLKETSVCVRVVRVPSSVEIDHCLHFHLTCVVPGQKSVVSETTMEF